LKRTISTLQIACSSLLLAIFINLQITASLYAQYQDSPRATLHGWEQQLRLFILDRSNNKGGFYYNRGLFRMHTQDMTMEYELDLFTYGFSYFEDYDWYSSENGFRSSMGSLNTPIFALRSEFKNRISVTDNSDLEILGYQQEDIRARRGLFILRYNYNFGNHHNIGVRHTLVNQKTDLDASFFYQYSDTNKGIITAELTLLDWANNMVTGLSEERQAQFDILHRYTRRPNLYTLWLESPVIRRFRCEIVIGIQSQARAEVTQTGLPDQGFLLDEWANYQAALFETHFTGGSAGIIYQRTFARMQREPGEDSLYELDYGNRQIQQRGGLFITYKKGYVGIEQWFWIERNRDQQFDNNPDAYVAQDPFVRLYDTEPHLYPFDYNEIRRFNKTRIIYEPDSWRITAYLEHNGDWRSPSMEDPSIGYRNYYPNHIVARNERLTLGINIHFTKNAMLTVGSSLDLDGDRYSGFDTRRENAKPAVFDGGFGRFYIVW